jgi:hypothetical protein
MLQEFLVLVLGQDIFNFFGSILMVLLVFSIINTMIKE